MKELTVEDLKQMEPGKIFATGTCLHPFGREEEEIRWIAKRGGIHDWTIYYGSVNDSVDHIKMYGNKLIGDVFIRRLVACDTDALQMYRR